MDWKSSLEALKDSLPQGEEASANADERAASGDAGTAIVAEKARLDVLLDRKGRKGKDATIIAGFTIDDDAVAALAAKLKQKLGTGGSSRGGEILIQGDKRRRVLELLKEWGYKARVI